MDSIKSRTVIGIENNSNLCYLNSVLQLLFTIEPLNKFILKYKVPITPKSIKDCLIISYKNIIENIYVENVNCNKEKICIDDDNIIESTQFKNILDKIYHLGDIQHDAHEILIIILDLLHDCMKESRITETYNKNENCLVSKVAMDKWRENLKIDKYSIINKLFKGQLRNKITCNVCFTENNVFDSYNCITLRLQDSTKEIKNESSKIEDCIKRFLSLEKIDYNCERCKKICKAEKITTFLLFPQFLLFHINRFEHTVNDGVVSITKDKTKIKFPLENLEMGPNVYYKLKGFISHHGYSVNSGHYTTLIHVNENYIMIDDENLYFYDEIPEFGDTYILLYEKIIK